MDWVQVYDPLGSPLWSTLLATLPVLALLGLLAGGFDAPKSALAGLIIALGVAIVGFGMPGDAASASAAYGACFGLLPIGWIVVAAVFLFHLTVKSGQIARLAGSRPDGQRYLVERPVRQSAANHRRAIGAKSDFDRRLQQHWRCDGQND